MVVTPPRVGQRAITREKVDRRALAAFNAAQICSGPRNRRESANGFANEPHNTARSRTSQDRMVALRGDQEPEHTLSYGTARGTQIMNSKTVVRVTVPWVEIPPLRHYFL